MDGTSSEKGFIENSALRRQLKAQEAVCAKLIREKNEALQTIEDATTKIK